MISDGTNSPTFTVNFNIVANQVPTFVSTPLAQSTPAGTPKTYTLPNTIDTEGDTVTITLISSGASFVTFTSPNILNINPLLTDAAVGTVTS